MIGRTLGTTAQRSRSARFWGRIDFLTIRLMRHCDILTKSPSRTQVVRSLLTAQTLETGNVKDGANTRSPMEDDVSNKISATNVPSLSGSLIEKTHTLVNLIPPGSVGTKTWDEARKIFAEWAKRPKGAPKVEEILERLAEEAAVNSEVKLTATIYNQSMTAWASSGDARRAEQIFQRMQDRHNADPLRSPRPDIISYNSILHAWAISKDKQATTQVEKLIRRMENSPDVSPETWSYNLVMLAYANRVGEYGAAKAAEDWLLYLSELNLSDGPRPDVHSFNLVLKAWGNSGDYKGPDRALEILRLLIKLSKEGHDVHPDRTSFLTVIDCYAQRGQPEIAQQILFLTDEVNLPARTDLTPCFNAVINAWAKSRSKDAGHMAEVVLKDALSYSSNAAGEIRVRPNPTSYTACLEAHTNSDHPHALGNAESFLEQMIGAYRRGESQVSPTTATFTCMVHAWARSNRTDGPQKAEEWLKRMNDLATNHSFNCLPDIVVFNICIDAWVKHDEPYRAARLLDVMEQSYQNGNRRCQPSGFSYRVVIHRLLSYEEKKDALMALELVKRMEQQIRQGNASAQPDIHTCSRVIRRLVETREEKAIEGAFNLLLRLDRLSRPELRPSCDCFLRVMSGLATLPSRSAKLAALKLYDRLEELERDSHNPLEIDSSAALRSVLWTLTKFGDVWAAEKADEVVKRALEHPRTDSGMDGRNLSLYLRCHLKAETPENAVKAYQLVKDMVRSYRNGHSKHIPSRFSFAGIIEQLSKLDIENSVDIALDMLNMMDSLLIDGAAQEGPAGLVYSNVIDILASHGKSELAETVLMRWDGLSGGTDRPSALMWNKVLRSWGKTQSSDKMRRARELLVKMSLAAQDGGATPDIISYNTVLNAAAYVDSNTEVRQEALELAKATFEETKVSQHVKPDEVTYGSFLKACSRLMPSGDAKVDFMKKTFEECCGSGHDGQLAIQAIRTVLPQDEVHAMHGKK